MWSFFQIRSLPPSLVFISIQAALAQVSEYEGTNTRVVSLDWGTKTSIGPNGPWYAIAVNTGNSASDATFYALPSLLDTNILVDRTVCKSDNTKCSDSWPEEWGVLSDGRGTIISNDYDIVSEGDLYGAQRLHPPDGCRGPW
jgi:hypothetical protein